MKCIKENIIIKKEEIKKRKFHLSLTIWKPFSDIEKYKLIKNNKQDIKGADTSKKTPILKKLIECLLQFIKLTILNNFTFNQRKKDWI